MPVMICPIGFFKAEEHGLGPVEHLWICYWGTGMVFGGGLMFIKDRSDSKSCNHGSAVCTSGLGIESWRRRSIMRELESAIRTRWNIDTKSCRSKSHPVVPRGNCMNKSPPKHYSIAWWASREIPWYGYGLVVKQYQDSRGCLALPVHRLRGPSSWVRSLLCWGQVYGRCAVGQGVPDKACWWSDAKVGAEQSRNHNLL